MHTEEQPQKVRQIHPSSQILTQRWPAQWCAPPDHPPCEPGVFHFRLRLRIDEVPERYALHITADQRYRFFVNGNNVCYGPARGDPLHWRFASVDIAPLLRQGENVLAAVVWTFGDQAPWAQMSARLGFLVCGDTEAERAVDTPGDWHWSIDPGWETIGRSGHMDPVVGPGERLVAADHPWGWKDARFDDGEWQSPVALAPANPFGVWDREPPWTLVPRPIPLMVEQPAGLGTIVRVRGVEDEADPDHFTIPPHAEAEILFDHEELCNSFPEVGFSGGRGAQVTLTYAEALWKEGEKGHRDEVEGREIEGWQDEILPDGSLNRTFSPLWWRTFRYLQLDVRTKDEPLDLHDLSVRLTGYPLELRAAFSCNDPEVNHIWDVGWHTAELCAGETYFDCPYYEQLQYVGDTRIQALITLYNSGDDRLVRNAIECFNESIIPEGLTQSRYPSHPLQVIPPFSLLWIGMVYDFWMLRDDAAFVRRYVPNTRGILDWFEEYRREDGLLGPIGWWPFADWAWDRGTPPGAEDGGSTILTLQYVAALQEAAELEAALGLQHLAEQYRSRERDIRAAVRERCFMEDRGILADTPEKTSFSQHSNTLAVLTGLFSGEEARNVMERTLETDDLTPCTYYFRYYLHRAAKKAGLGERYIELLQPWRELLELGFTTWPERPEPTRSDCHAWSAHPNYELLATVCGIEPAAPGFQAVHVEPHLGPLAWVEGRLPHPNGPIEVHFTRAADDRLEGWVDLPPDLPGVFVWRDEEYRLEMGEKTRLETRR